MVVRGNVMDIVLWKAEKRGVDLQSKKELLL